LAKLLLTFGSALISKMFAPDHKRLSMDPKKAKTMEALIKSVLRYLVYFITAITALSIFGIRTDSLLASAGIVGLAVGFGAQSLVRDVLTGFFIIFEDQFAVGDYIETAGVTGYVEEMGFRVTKLRDFSGVIHILPNGEIGKVTNHTRGNRSAIINVSVAYEEDVNLVQDVLEQAMAALAGQITSIVEGPTVLGITELGASDVQFRIIAKTLPMEQWSVERAMRKAAKQALDQAGIEIPYPHIVTVPYQQGKE
jgi:small conductance mechanosensitive channel